MNPVHSNGIRYNTYQDIGVTCSDGLLNQVLDYQGRLISHFSRGYIGARYNITVQKNSGIMLIHRRPPNLSSLIEYLATVFTRFSSDMTDVQHDPNKKYLTIVRLISFLDFIHPFRDGNARTHDFCLQFFLCNFFQLKPLLIFDPAFLSFGIPDIQKNIIQEGRVAYQRFICEEQPVHGNFLLNQDTLPVLPTQTATALQQQQQQQQQQPAAALTPRLLLPAALPRRNLFLRSPAIQRVIGVNCPAIVRATAVDAPGFLPSLKQ